MDEPLVSILVRSTDRATLIRVLDSALTPPPRCRLPALVDSGNGVSAQALRTST